MRIYKLVGIVFGFALAAGATPTMFSFTSSGGTTGGTSPFGNTRTYTNGANSVTASAFALPSNLFGNFMPGQLNQYGGLGLSVCGPEEGANCPDPLHQVDNSGQYDFVLFVFNGQVDPISIVINPYGTYDRDITYWVGNTTGDLSTLTLATLGMGPRFDNDASTSSSALTVTPLLGGFGNSLLIATRLPGNGADSYIDRFKIESLTVEISQVPEPATFGLMGLALVGLGLVRRRQRKS